MAQGKKKKKKEEAPSRKSKEKKNYNKIKTLIKTRIEKKKKEKKKQHTEALGQVAHGHFCHLAIRFPPPSFLLILGRKIFGGSWKKTTRPHHHFPPSSFQSNTFQKVFSPVVVVVKSTLPNTPLLQVGWKMELGMEPCTGLRPPKV